MDERFEELLTLALKSNSTDIHFNVSDTEVTINLKTINGLKKVNSSREDNKLYNYLQYQSHLDVSCSDPQSGSFSYYFKGKYYDFRFSTIQSRQNKNGVLRILNCEGGLSLKQLTYDQKVIELFNNLINRRSGLVLFSGLTGSGKTTTMYSLLKLIKNKTIYSLEDPIEVVCDNIVQLEINPKQNLTFDKGIRQILRHNPDVVMIGEIRDEESAQMAIRCALTGCLVFSSIHSSSTTGALRRLVELKVNKQDIEEVLIALFNQRLVKRYRENNYWCVYDYFLNDDISRYFDGEKVENKMKQKIKEAEENHFIDKVSEYE